MTGRRRPQIFIFTHHKVGTVLFLNVMRKISERFGLSGTPALGLVTSIDRNADVVVFGHSLLGLDLSEYDYRAVHLVRDPRDVWVSGYLYHRRCTERWCINTDLMPKSPIMAPQVPISQQHMPEVWKAKYLAGLGGKSYQQNLIDLSRRDGMRFELDRYAAWTIEAMASWTPPPDCLEMQMEAFAEDFDAAMSAVLTHLGFAGEAHADALQIARTEDIGRMDDARVAADPHIHGRKLSKWRDFLDADDLAAFDERFGFVLPMLGYEVTPA